MKNETIEVDEQTAATLKTRAPEERVAVGWRWSMRTSKSKYRRSRVRSDHLSAAVPIARRRASWRAHRTDRQGRGRPAGHRQPLSHPLTHADKQTTLRYVRVNRKGILAFAEARIRKRAADEGQGGTG